MTDQTIVPMVTGVVDIGMMSTNVSVPTPPSRLMTSRVMLLSLIVAVHCSIHDPTTWAQSTSGPATSTPTMGTLDLLHSPLLRDDLRINGAQSCATSNCHAGPRPGVAHPWVMRGSEYQLWIENDPHANSWRTISSDESVQIMRKLKIMDGDEIVDRAGFDNCLACHNSTKRFDEPRRHPIALSEAGGRAASMSSIHREGVGCSACHGPSELWIHTHFQENWSPVGATDQGFIEAGDLYVRARMCASCHVGDKDRDMNHDMIAAGHPALRYELATFHAWQPKHWRDAESADRTHYEAQLWLAGQIAATDASLSLIVTRAGDSHTASEWPEFSSFDCASCHHNLGLDNDRKPITDTRKAVASLSRWNDAGLRWLLNHRIETGVALTEDLELIEALDAVTAAMESQPKPDADDASRIAKDARMALSRWFLGMPGIQEQAYFRSDRLGRVVASAAGKRATFRTWESTTQFYLAAVAARESWPGGWNGPLRNLADEMRVGLRYPQMINVSRFAKRGSTSRPTLDRIDAMRLGIELAGWLGPVSPEPMSDEDDDGDITEAMQSELQGMIREINARWQETNREQLRDAKRLEAEKANEKLEADKEPEIPRPTEQQLREQLRRRLNLLETDDAAENDATGDDE